eukprot:gnl/Chilomastix_caulleri/1757.p1 GENE.gnl/Chilomastix_caulleri/1757~~gnl/Chilomastix_caulleri/1757.p1  ORF type:complete len:133 (+),score=48.19 gnl/Chilomastix_caulleri/1757:151-549(+)
MRVKRQGKGNNKFGTSTQNKKKANTGQIEYAPFMTLAFKLMLRIVDLDIYCDTISLKYMKSCSSLGVTCTEANYIAGNNEGGDEYCGELGITETDSKTIFKDFVTSLNAETIGWMMKMYDADEKTRFKIFVR